METMFVALITSNDDGNVESIYEYVVDTTKENEMKFCCDGADNADTSDTMFVYVKVSKD